MVNTTHPLWWYLPTIPARYHQALSTLASEYHLVNVTRPWATESPSTSEELNDSVLQEIQLLWTRVLQTLGTLRSSQHSQWLADLHLTSWQWTSPQVQQSVESLIETPMPPYRYEVELILVAPPVDHLTENPNQEICEPQITQVENKRLILSPAELALITQLDYDIGRRIGDELDGQPPRETT